MKIGRGLVAMTALGMFVAALQACATDASTDDVDGEDSGPALATDAAKPDATTPRPDAARPDSATPDSSRPDSTTPDTSVPEAGDSSVTPRAGDPFDPSAPATGANCPAGVNENDVISRRCGRCGTQSALCEMGRKVGAYGACTAEKPAATSCLPNEVLVNECGFCGQQVTRCDTTCTYTQGACVNQVANGCVKNEVIYLDGVCPSVTEYRKQTCSATCTKGAPEACAPRALDEITVSQTAGATVVGSFVTTATLKEPLLSGTCPATASTMVSSVYTWTKITNGGADSANVTITNGIPSGGTTRAAVNLAAYAGGTIPTNRLACTGSVATTSPERLTVNIPAGSSIMVHTMLDSATAVQTRISLEVKTNFIGAEVGPAVDHVLTIGANANDTVTQAISFSAGQILERVSSGACPRTLSTDVTAYRYVRLVNPTGTAKTVDVSGDDPEDTVLAIYPGPNAPVSSARGACVGSANDTCLASGFTMADSCLAGVSIPANGSVVAYITEYYDDEFNTTTLRVTTKN